MSLTSPLIFKKAQKSASSGLGEDNAKNDDDNQSVDDEDSLYDMPFTGGEFEADDALTWSSTAAELACIAKRGMQFYLELRVTKSDSFSIPFWNIQRLTLPFMFTATKRSFSKIYFQVIF